VRAAGFLRVRREGHGGGGEKAHGEGVACDKADEFAHGEGGSEKTAERKERKEWHGLIIAKFGEKVKSQKGGMEKRDGRGRAFAHSRGKTEEACAERSAHTKKPRAPNNRRKFAV